MIPFSIQNAIEITGGQFFGPDTLLSDSFDSVSIDTRTMQPGALYVPVKGDVFDGHRFIPQAMEKGAKLTLSEVDTPYPHILVSNSVKAFQALAHAYRCQFDIPLVGITGSAGKTTTRGMVSAVLSTAYNTHSTTGNLNNQTGVPQVLFGLTPEHQCAVVEMGTNHFGEIDALAAMSEPTMCLITNIGEAHIEFFGSREGIFRGKTEMLPHMRPGGRIIVNGDDEYLCRIPDAFTFGFGKQNDLWAEDAREDDLFGASFTACWDGGCLPIQLQVPGHHMILNALSAVAVGLALHVPPEKIQLGLAGFAPISGRMAVEKLPRFTLLNDVYNANPTSMKASLQVLSRAAGRKVCILGDMLELGEQAAELHERVVQEAAELGIDVIVGVGPLFHAAMSHIHGLGFDTQADMLKSLPDLLKTGDAILVKGSRGMHLEKTVDAIRAM